MTNINQPITMDDDKQSTPPEPQHHVAHSWVNLFLEAVTKHIDMLVETKFNAMVENRRALHLMDQALETMIDQKIDRAVEQAMTEHEVNTDHWERHELEEITAHTQEGWVTKDQVQDIITEHVDEELDRIDWEEKVKDVLRDML